MAPLRMLILEIIQEFRFATSFHIITQKVNFTHHSMILLAFLQPELYHHCLLVDVTGMPYHLLL